MSDEQKTVIKLHKNRSTDLEFDVGVSGLSESQMEDMFVGFNIRTELYDMRVHCERKESGKWCVTIPKLDQQVQESLTGFSVEMVVDGYFFSPVEGDVDWLKEPEVKVAESSPVKPQVAITFSSSAEEEVEELIEEAEETQPVGEAVVVQPEPKKTVNRPKGKLFQTDETGKKIVPGFLTKEQQLRAAEKAERVRNVLSR